MGVKYGWVSEDKRGGGQCDEGVNVVERGGY